jgi:glycosyltransferase involved in cell wall biosynthesis
LYPNALKIAQVAPLAEAVPPKFYGGTERVVSWLTEELVRLGHDVTLFATGDSTTSAKLEPAAPIALRLAPERQDPMLAYAVMMAKVATRIAEFDVVHCHVDWQHIPLLKSLQACFLTTLHGRLDLPQLVPSIEFFGDAPFVSISNSQRAPLPDVNWIGTVYHGIPDDLFKASYRPQGHLAFLGRITPEKGPDIAIRLARAAQLPLKIAAKVDDTDAAYFHSHVEPLLEGGAQIEFVGEIGEGQKNDFLGNARALLFPIDWPEPFGLVMVEAMACGTPVIAFRRGSVPEVIEHGVSGFIVEPGDDEGALDAIGRVGSLNRRSVRAAFEERFTARRMAEDYVRLYTSLPSVFAPHDLWPQNSPARMRLGNDVLS